MERRVEMVMNREAMGQRQDDGDRNIRTKSLRYRDEKREREIISLIGRGG